MITNSPVLSIPSRLNIGLALFSWFCSMCLLWFVSHATQLWQMLVGAVAFSYINNTLFSLLHEAVHGVFHSSQWLNDFFGRWLAAAFPTSFTLQRFFHLGHHRRNRSRAEQFDYIAPGQNILLKNIQWYGILTGLYWLLPPLSSLVYVVVPDVYTSRFFQGDDDKAAWSRQSGADAMLADVESVRRAVASAEVVFWVLWQAAIFRILDLNGMGWGLCYAAFAINWSSLQYADHAWSPLDPIRGAWNLRVNAVVRWLFLNYHHHRAHHENPKIPWVHLPRFVDPREPSPSFLGIYLSMWKGPRPLPREA